MCESEGSAVENCHFSHSLVENVFNAEGDGIQSMATADMSSQDRDSTSDEHLNWRLSDIEECVRYSTAAAVVQIAEAKYLRAQFEIRKITVSFRHAETCSGYRP